MRTLLPKAGEKFVSIASFLRKEGRKEGRKESIIEVAINLISLDFDNEIIMNVTNLSEEKIDKLRKNTEDKCL